MRSIDAAYCYTHCGVVCLCICVSARNRDEPCKTAKPIEMPSGVRVHNHVLYLGPDPPGEGAIMAVGIHSMPAVGIFNKAMRPLIALLRSLVTF